MMIKLEKVSDQVTLALLQRLAGDAAGAKITAEQARNILEPLYKNQRDNHVVLYFASSRLCSDGGEELGPKRSGACNQA